MLEYLRSRFNISQTFVESLFENQIWCGNGCFVQRDGSGKVVSFEMFYRGNCGWRDRTQTYFTCNFEERAMTYLVVNCSERSIKRITDRDVVGRPFALDALLADECLKAWQDAIIHYRTKLIEYEYHDIDTDNKETLSSATNHLHGLSSNLHRVTEHLADFEERMVFLRDVLDTYAKASKQHTGWYMGGGDVDDSFKFLISGAQMCGRWAVNYRVRAGLMINLMFHLCSQTDNKISAAMISTSVEISRLTSAISEETQRDNSAMITLSVVAMLFLPGTFVSGIFSMTFFNYSPATTSSGSFTVSRNWWLYLAVTVPLTLGVFAVWDAWRRHRLRRGKLERESMDAENIGTGTRKAPARNSSLFEMNNLRFANPGGRNKVLTL